MGAIIAQEVIELKDVTQSGTEKRAPDGGYGWFVVLGQFILMGLYGLGKYTLKFLNQTEIRLKKVIPKTVVS